MSDIQEQIKIAHRKALEQDFNEILKELKQEEHKNLELSMRIDKAISYIKENGCFNEEYKLCTKPFNTLKLDDLLDILKGDNK